MRTSLQNILTEALRLFRTLLSETDGPLTPEQKARLQTAHQCTERLQALFAQAQGQATQARDLRTLAICIFGSAELLLRDRTDLLNTRQLQHVHRLREIALLLREKIDTGPLS